MNGQLVIEGSYTVLPPSGFFVRAKAAFAIAAELYPDDERRRAEATARLAATIYDALCAGQLVGRDPDLRLPIERRDLAGAMILSSCIISESDLNAWLAALGVGIKIQATCLAAADDSNPLSLDEEERAITPGPERDEAMLQAHERYEAAGARNTLVLVAREFRRSRSVVRDCIRRARECRPKEGRETESISGSTAWSKQISALTSNRPGR